MARRHHYRRRTKDAPELDITTFLNLMVVLVPFLLITAVFSRLTIVELDLPSSSGGPTSSEPEFRLEVIVREEGMELTNGRQVIAAIPKKDGDYDMETLSDYVISLKQQYRSQTAASVLMEPMIPYDYLIQVMDIVRSTQMPVVDGEVRLSANQSSENDPAGSDADEFAQLPDGGEQAQMQMVSLFPDISVGDAP